MDEAALKTRSAGGMAAPEALIGIDHALVGVRDLEAARDAWGRLGFTTTPRGRHVGWGTANYCIMLDRGYIELIGIVDPRRFVNDLDRFLERREGLLGLAFASDDVAATKRRLEAAGLHPDGPKTLQRRLELPEGEALAAFDLLFLPPDETPDLRAFICRHATPTLVRRPDWQRHPNGARRLAGLTVVSGRPAAAALGYRALFGDAAILAGDDGVMVETGAGTLRFVTPAGLGRLYPGTPPAPPPPALAAMTIAVADLDATVRCLAAAGLRPIEGGGGLVLPPREATGVVLEFSAEDDRLRR